MDRHWWVISPEFIVGGDNWTEPYEMGRDVVSVLAGTKREAVIAGVKKMNKGEGYYSAFKSWPKTARADGMNPFSGVKAEPAECLHGRCFCDLPECANAAEECSECNAAADAEA